MINKAKQRMLEGKAALGVELSLGAPLAAELISAVGYDFILVDTQHGPWSDDVAMQTFRSISLGKAVPMARVEQNDYGAIGRLLDRGALGIVIPMVNSAEEAAAAAYATRFPPQGGRSGGPFGVGFHGPDYMNWSNDEIFLAVMIETQTGLERVDEIVAVEGVDGCWVGPHDLRLSMGLDLNTSEGRAAHEVAIIQVVEACRQANKISGISTGSAAAAQPWIDRGCRFVTVGEDAEWMLDGARETWQQFGRSS